jgi:hypothetical protein
MVYQIKNYFPFEYYDHLYDLIVDPNVSWNINRISYEEREYPILKKILYNKETQKTDSLWNAFISIIYFVSTKHELLLDNYGSIIESNIVSLLKNSSQVSLPKEKLAGENCYSIFYFIGDNDSNITFYNENDHEEQLQCEPNTLIISDNQSYSISYPQKFSNVFIFTASYQKQEIIDIFIPSEICSSCITPPE